MTEVSRHAVDMIDGGDGLRASAMFYTGDAPSVSGLRFSMLRGSCYQGRFHSFSVGLPVIFSDADKGVHFRFLPFTDPQLLRPGKRKRLP